MKRDLEKGEKGLFIPPLAFLSLRGEGKKEGGGGGALLYLFFRRQVVRGREKNLRFANLCFFREQRETHREERLRGLQIPLMFKQAR